MKIAIEGCCHGELDNIYQTLADAEAANGFKVDLLICCGDFQAVRNMEDLQTMACPAKYRSMNTFYKYYSGEAEAPVTTIFIGGNHEASNHLWELPYGGWVAKNIFYLGFAGVVTFGGVRIAGLSGIYNENHYSMGHFERPPFNDSSMRSAYHVREFDVFQLGCLRQPVDVFLSHDWPRNIAHHGDLQGLLRRKSFLRSEIEDGSFGSPPAEHLLHTLQPTYWFSAHMHTKFPAVVRHKGLGAAFAAAAADKAAGGEKRGGGRTRFLALDKCLPRRDFMQILDVGEMRGPAEVCVDEEWVAILRSTHRFRSTTKKAIPLPQHGDPAQRWDFAATAAEVAAVRQIVAARGNPAWPAEFARTTAPYDPAATSRRVGRAVPLINPQTAEFCHVFGLPNPCTVAGAITAAQLRDGVPASVGGPAGAPGWLPPPPPGMPAVLAPLHALGGPAAADPNEIALDESDDEAASASAVTDPNAIAIGDSADDDDDDDGDAAATAAPPVADPNAIAVDMEDTDDEDDGGGSRLLLPPPTQVANPSATTMDVEDGGGQRGDDGDAAPQPAAGVGLIEVPVAGGFPLETAPQPTATPETTGKAFVFMRRNRNVDTGEELD